MKYLSYLKKKRKENFSNDLENYLKFHKPRRFSMIRSEKLKGFKSKIQEIYEIKTGKKLILESIQEDEKKRSFYKKIYQHVWISSITSIISIIWITAFLEFECKDKLNKTFLNHLFNSLLTLILLINVIFTEITKLRQYPHKFNLLSIIFQIVIVIPHPNILFYDINFFSYSQKLEDYIERNLNCIMSLFIFLRFFFIIKYLIYRKHYLDVHMEVICEKNYFHVDIYYAIRAVFIEYPNRFIFVLFFVFTYFFSFAFILFERNLPYSLIKTYFDSIWFSFVDMFLIGYGDINVVSFEGRIMSVLACFTGCFLLSLFICSVISILLFKTHELKQMELFNKVETDEEYIEKGKLLIQKLFETNKNNNKNDFLIAKKQFDEIDFKKNFQISEHKQETYFLDIIKQLEEDLHKMDYEGQIIYDNISEMTNRLNYLYKKIN